jgi:hypothetical protein
LLREFCFYQEKRFTALALGRLDRLRVFAYDSAGFRIRQGDFFHLLIATPVYTGEFVLD